MSEKDGGPAFPVVGMDQRGGQQFVSIFNGGMTLRDYFATHCPITWADMMRTDGQSIPNYPDERMAHFTRIRFEYADAMLAARSK